MKETDLTALVFLVLGAAIVWGILSGIFKMIGTNWNEEIFSAGAVWSIFKWPIIALILLVLYIFGIMPKIQ